MVHDSLIEIRDQCLPLQVVEHRSHQHMMAMVKAAPNSDTPVVQGLVGALENVVGFISGVAFGPLS